MIISDLYPFAHFIQRESCSVFSPSSSSYWLATLARRFGTITPSFVVKISTLPAEAEAAPTPNITAVLSKTTNNRSSIAHPLTKLVSSEKVVELVRIFSALAMKLILLFIMFQA